MLLCTCDGQMDAAMLPFMHSSLRRCSSCKRPRSKRGVHFTFLCNLSSLNELQQKCSSSCRHRCQRQSSTTTLVGVHTDRCTINCKKSILAYNANSLLLHVCIGTLHTTARRLAIHAMSFDVPDTDTVYISGFPEDITEPEIAEYFGSIGVLKLDKKARPPKPKIWLYRDKTTGALKGDGTVSYEDPFAAGSAVEWFNNKEWKGAGAMVVAHMHVHTSQRRLDAECQPRTKQEQRPGIQRPGRRSRW